MKREVVQNFLNLPGIAGIALMDGRSRPYFCGVDQALNFRQREALAQGIQQVVETTPTGFDFFEFQFTGHQVYLYKLDHSVILLVLTRSSLVYPTYSNAVDQLKSELREDFANAIATFRLLAGNITLSNQTYWEPRSEVTQTTETSSSVTDELDSDVASTSAPALPEPQVELKELLVALNHLSQFTTRYLGTTVIANYWRSSCPEGDWLNRFQVDRSAQITFTSASADSEPQFITAEQHQWVQVWISAFVQRCSKVIRDFLSIIEQRALDEQQKSLLLVRKS